MKGGEPNKKIDPYPVQPRGRGCTGPVILVVGSIDTRRRKHNMLRDITLIMAGLLTTAILAFASHDSPSRTVRILFWICLLATGAVILTSGISGIQTSSKLQSVTTSLSEATNNVHELRQEIQRYKPFRMTEQDKAILYRTAKELVAKEGALPDTPPRLQFLTFPGQSTDAVELQEVLKNAFEVAGKKATSQYNLGMTSSTLDGSPWDGVIVQVNDYKHPPLLAIGIFELLQQLGIKVGTHEGSGFGANVVLILSHRPSYIKKIPDKSNKTSERRYRAAASKLTLARR